MTTLSSLMSCWMRCAGPVPACLPHSTLSQQSNSVTSKQTRNFVTLKHWFDLQVMDFGHPQFTEAKILSEYIKTDAYKMAVRG
jgi:hypothetical protein